MTESIDAVEIVITGPPDFIDGHCQRLVNDRLVACAQVAQISSTYHWEGRVESDREARASLHTLRSKVDEIGRLTRQDHPYDVPCILVLKLEAGDQDYLRWIATSVDGASTPDSV